MSTASAQIDSTNASLDNVIRTGQSGAQQAEVKTALDNYANNVKKMDQDAKAVSQHIDQMNAQGNSYFQEWSKQGGKYTDPNIQKLSEENRARLSKQFSDITLASAGLRGSLNAYVSELKQIQTFLSNNLSPQGVSSIGSVAEKARRDGDRVKASLEPVQTALNRALLSMSPGGAAAGGPGTGGAATAPTGTDRSNLLYQ